MLQPPTTKRLIFVSHQIPWIFDHDSNSFSVRRGHEAQFAGSQSLTPQYTLCHVGWAKEPQSPHSIDEFWKQKRAVAIELDAAVAQAHYEGYCKNELWPLFHYLLWDNATDGQVESKNFQAYKDVNEKFAQAIASIYEPGDLVWIQDYHLLLVPTMLRNRIPTATIGFFMHMPFPSSEIFRCLPKRSEILTGVLGSNLIGFQTYSHARHFISSCTRVIGCESSPSGVDFHGFHVSIGIFPMGINLDRLVALNESESVQEKVKHIRSLFQGKKVIVGRDTMDHVKGIQHKLDAFEKFLELYPEWRDKVALVQVSSTNQENPNFLSKVAETINRINGMYGSLASVPIHHLHHRLDPEEYYALMCIADAALITPLRDGMNTTSHEFVVCQKEKKGVLILSEFAGTAGAMAGAMLVNPWDVLGVAHAINEALVKPMEDRLVKHDQLYKYVTTHTADIWAERFIKELVVKTSIPDQTTPTPFLDFSKVHSVYKSSRKRLILFDYDGTLTPIRKVPEAAVPPPEMLRALEKLVEDPNNVVFVISGRDQDCLDNWLGHISGLGLSAEHGSFIKYPRGKWINLAAEIDMTWKQEVAEIFDYYTERTQGSFVEHKRCSITWHYRLADPEYGSFQAKECQYYLEEAILSKLPVEVMVGKKNLEVRPISMNKGEIVKRLANARQPDCDFVICAGDDRTDEDMFRVLSKTDINSDHIFSCTIGSATKMTRATWHVTAPHELISLLHLLAFDKPAHSE
ncbi:threalose-6-phosphate phosphatase [Kappamyces sp. JEL0829]|nr:threalose-6-phosphate phosphatase [Kappamyces sp. JEL0829]